MSSVSFHLAVEVSMCIKANLKGFLLAVQVRMQVLEIARWTHHPSPKQAAQSDAESPSGPPAPLAPAVCPKCPNQRSGGLNPRGWPGPLKTAFLEPEFPSKIPPVTSKPNHNPASAPTCWEGKGADPPAGSQSHMGVHIYTQGQDK